MDYILVAFLFFSIVINIFLLFLIYKLLLKIEILEEWVVFFRKEISEVYKKLKFCDERNMFEKDDDVGFLFSELVRIVEEFDKRIR